MVARHSTLLPRISAAMLLICGAISAQAQTYNLTTFAGKTVIRDGIPANTAYLRSARGVAVDAAGNLYIVDRLDSSIRKVTPNGIITTVAGNGVSADFGDNGPATAASLDTPTSVAIDKSGNLYIAEDSNFIRKVDARTGIITRIAGNGNFRVAGDGGPATAAQFDPQDIAVDDQGNIYIADTSNNRIRKIAAGTGIISTIAGSGVQGFSGDTGSATLAQLNSPISIAVDASGSVYFSDLGNNRIRKITAAGVITTVAGTGDLTAPTNNVAATASGLGLPDGINVDAAGDLYIADTGYGLLRKVTIATGQITTIAGDGDLSFGGDGGPALSAKFGYLEDVAVDAAGNIYVADDGNNRVRRINPQGTVATVAGTSVQDGRPATEAFLNLPSGVAADAQGNVYIADTSNNRVRRVTSDGVINTITGSGIAGSGGNRVNEPNGVAVDAQGNVYVADSGNNRVLKITPGGARSIFAGTGQAGSSGDNGGASRALLRSPLGVAVDAQGNVYISDTGNNRVRRVSAADGIITTVAGNGQASFSGDNGPATSAGLTVIGIAVDAQGNLFIADAGNNRIRKVATGTNLITTVAGSGAAGFAGDNGNAISAQLQFPTGVAVDSAGNLIIADYDNLRVRRVTPAGIISTIAGTGELDAPVESGPATTVDIDAYGVAVDASGNIYVVDLLNDRIRKLTPATTTSNRLAINDGDKQSGTPGTVLPKPLKVQVTNGNGQPVAGVTVNFAVTSGSATLNPTTATTGADGIASTQVTLGSTVGTAVITASSSGLTNQTFTAIIVAAGTVAPQINSGGVVGAGLSAPAVSAISTNGIASIFGQNFAPAGTARGITTSDLVNGRLPQVLAGACVLVGDTRAPLFAVYPGQINFQVPAVTGSTVSVRVATNCGTVNEAVSAVETVAVRAATPEFFAFVNNADGRNPIAAIDSVTGDRIGPAGLIAGTTFRAAKPGDVVTLFATGFGPVNPSVGAGDVPTAAAAITGTATVTIGGQPVPAQNILYVGVTPGFSGLYQLNLRVPTGIAAGNQPVVITIGNVQSPAGAYLTIGQ